MNFFLKNKTKNIICLIALAISFIILFINEHFFKAIDDVLYNIILTISITLLTTAIFSLISNLFTNDIDTIAENNFSVLNCCHNTGLIGIFDAFPLTCEEIKNDFIKSKEVYIVMNDAKAFISSNMALINERIENRASTTFVLQNYNQDDVMTALTRKNGHSEDLDYYKKKIKGVIDYHIRALHKKNKKHTVKLFLSSNYNTLAIILTDKYAMMSTYRYASEKSKVPHFIFSHNGSEYNNIKNDIKALLKLSQEYTLDESNDDSKNDNIVT